MKKYKLPFNVDVEMITFQHKAFPLGIIKANLPTYDVWICHKFINIYSWYKKCFIAHEKDIWSKADNLFLEQSVSLSPAMYSKNYLDIIELNKQMLRDGYYILGFYNEFYIHKKWAFNSRDFDHDYVIFGYDDESKVFYSAGYLEDDIYQEFSISYSDYYQSTIGYTSPLLSITYYKFNEQAPAYTINISKVCEALEDYLLSRKSPNASYPDCSYGMDAWDELVDHVTANKDKRLDTRCSRMYMEFRGVMLKKLNVLLSHSYIKQKDLLDEYYAKVYSKAKTIHCLFIKYNLTKNPNIIPKMLHSICEINNDERIIIKQVLEDIKHNQSDL